MRQDLASVLSFVLAQVQIVQGEEKEVHCIYIKTSLKESGQLEYVKKKKMNALQSCMQQKYSILTYMTKDFK